MELNEVTQTKLEELNEMSVTDEKFKDSANAVCNLMETQAKIENQKKDIKSKIWTGIIAGIGLVTPFIMNALNNKHQDEQLDKILEYEKSGVIMSKGGNNVLNSVFRKH